MQVDHHPLIKEFPEFKGAIQALKLSDRHFSKLYDEYHDTDNSINRAENGVENLDDASIDDLKKLRLSLKDQLFSVLQNIA